MSTRTVALSFALAAFVCGCEAPTDADLFDDTDIVEEPSASLDDCAGDLEVGRCGVVGTLAECVGGAGEEHVFVPVLEGDVIRIITGFQGSRMLALAARTTDIDPGVLDAPPSDAQPLVDASVLASEVSVVGRYRTWVPFTYSPTEAESLEALELYVQLESANPVESGQALTALVTVVDNADTLRCGTVGFVAE